MNQLVLQNLIMKIDCAVVEDIPSQNQGTDCLHGGELLASIGFLRKIPHELHEIRIFVVLCPSELIGKPFHGRHVLGDRF